MFDIQIWFNYDFVRNTRYMVTIKFKDVYNHTRFNLQVSGILKIGLGNMKF